MPYRRLPNTNQARLRTLKSAVEQGQKIGDIRNLAFSLKSLEDARSLLIRYERALDEYKQCSDLQVKSNKNYQETLKMARLYVSHFIQVVNMCVLRKEIKAEFKLLYGLQPENTVVPDLSTDEKLLEWGQKVINGEHDRQMKGGAPIYNPSIQKVKVFYENFAELENKQKVLQANTVRKMEEVNALNKEVDAIILQIWDEVENTYANKEEEEKLDKCKEYGIIYYYRRAEKRKMSMADTNSLENSVSLQEI